MSRIVRLVLLSIVVCAAFASLAAAGDSPSELPPNLQGKWNEDLNPPWEADYHHDVNLQMCYWPAEPGNLQAYTNALFTHMENFVAHGRKAARDLYTQVHTVTIAGGVA